MVYTDEDQDQNTLFKLFFDIGIKLGHLHDAIRDNIKMQKLAKRAEQPVLYEYTDTVTLSGGATFGVIRLTGPDQGHIWFVRGINVFDVTVGLSAAAITGSFFLCRSAADLRKFTAAQIPSYAIMESVEQGVGAATVNNPIMKTWTGEALTCRFNEEIYLVIVGGTTAHQYSATIRVLDVEEAAFSQDWAL